MNSFPVNCPKWLIKEFMKRGGVLSFHDFMNIVLNDTSNGYYGSGKAKIGTRGDFVTSPSLSNDFSYLLAMQIEDWSKQILKRLNSQKGLTILEFGSGDGCLMSGIIEYFLKKDSEIIKNISFKIIEANLGMIKKQKINLKKYLEKGIDISWINFCEIKKNNINGIVIAHEVLDAFPVERINYEGGVLHRQGVELNKENETINFINMPLSDEIKKSIEKIENVFGIPIPPSNITDEWKTEIHINSSIWLRNIFKKIDNGILLIIDYAIDSGKYYSANKTDGTILAYKNQRVNKNILDNPGDCDLTCHICSDLLIYEAESIGFNSIGIIKQGEALLSLGLAQRLFDIQKDININLSQALLRREALLRLVDPICLGDFKWFIFNKFNQKELEVNTKCFNYLK